VVIRGSRVALRAVLVLVVLTTGCTGGGESAAAKESAKRWADTVCTGLGQWIDVAAAGPPAAAADAALRLRSGIAGTEPPDTDDGLAAQSEMDKLATAIEEAVRDADETEVAATVADARDAVDGVRGLTPGGAVESALASARPCRALRG
jgi:hypothetical protein